MVAISLEIWLSWKRQETDTPVSRIKMTEGSQSRSTTDWKVLLRIMFWSQNMQVYNFGHRLASHWSNIHIVESCPGLQGLPRISINQIWTLRKMRQTQSSPRHSWALLHVTASLGVGLEPSSWVLDNGIGVEVTNRFLRWLLKTFHHGIQPFLPVLWQCKKACVATRWKS